MRDYLVYSMCSELADRVAEADIPFIGGHSTRDDVLADIAWLVKEGFYSDAPSGYKKRLTEMIYHPRNYHWIIDGVERKCSLEDMLLFTGLIPAKVLDKEELWDFSRFGFENASSMIGSISAFIMNSQGSYGRSGYKWTNDGIETEITGDMHCDLRIFQTDLKQYSTLDPFGNKIPMRPYEQSIVAPYHSTEGSFLVAAMKYAEMMEIPYDHKELVAWGKTLGQGGGTCTEHFGGFDNDARMFFIGYDDIPASGHTRYFLPCMGGGGYKIFVDGDDMILKMREEERARFKPTDAVELIKGLIYQCAAGLGRTSAKQLFDILEYRFSDGFGKEW
ncbi:MAG: hypothetical protein V1729_03255 [Candidatus Woesearchaeota archaeon]